MHRYVITGTDFDSDTSSLGLISTAIRHHWDSFPQRYIITGTDFHRPSLGLISTEIRTSSLGLISTEMHHHLSTVISKNRNCGNTVVCPFISGPSAAGQTETPLVYVNWCARDVSLVSLAPLLLAKASEQAPGE